MNIYNKTKMYATKKMVKLKAGKAEKLKPVFARLKMKLGKYLNVSST